MSHRLCFTVMLLDELFHGRNQGGEPEWPPSPLRLFQALVNASAGRWNQRRELTEAVEALRWLEQLPPPTIIAPHGVAAQSPYRLYVPDNVTDNVAKSWTRGRSATIADYRTEKDVRPIYIEGETTSLQYLFEDCSSNSQHIRALTAAARSMTHLGWGIDMAIGNARVLTEEQAANLEGLRWLPSPDGSNALRIPIGGTIDDLMRKHTAFLGRISPEGFRPVPPLKAFQVRRYRRSDQPIQRPFRVFELRKTDGERFRYSPKRFIHIAGMVRHLAIEIMKRVPPSAVPSDWVETYVAGHRKQGREEHSQLSYLPLPSVGHQHADPGVRRVVIAAPPGDGAVLDYVARRLAGHALRPLNGNEFGGEEPPLLVPVRNDNVAKFYTQPANIWHSFTPIILPGHDDHSPGKTKALIERALVQSGIDQPCQFEWSPYSRFRKAFSAHKYDKQNRPTGYIRPDHLATNTAVHLTVRFNDNVKVPGPLVIGAGRHCGFGLMVAIDT